MTKILLNIIPTQKAKFLKSCFIFRTTLLDCVGGPTVKVPDTYMIGPFSQFECSGYQAPVSRLTGMKAPNGKAIAEIGYPLGADEFLPIIDEMVVSRISTGYIPRWAHYTLRNLPEKDGKVSPMKMKKGPLSHGMTYKLAYNRTLQIKTLMETLKDKDIVNLLMPVKGEINT